MRAITLFLAAVAIAGCGAKSKSGAATPGPNYSQTPCSENCGGDATCQSNCTPVSNQNLPPGMLPGK